MDDRPYFYLARLINAEGDRLASDEIWITSPTDPDSTPERVALDACGFFDAEHHESPAGCTVELSGPFFVDKPAHVFEIAEDSRVDAPDFWTATEIKGEPGELEIEYFDQDPDGDQDRAGDGYYFKLPGADSWSGPWLDEDEARAMAEEDGYEGP